MFFKKIVKFLKIPRWTLLPVLIYFFFIGVIVNLTFPIKRNSNKNFDQTLWIKTDKNDILAPQTVILANSINERNILRVAFKTADSNNDSFLSIEELARYINKRITDHIENAIRMNPINFSQIDLAPRDGLISWDEYHAHFLRERGLDEEYIKEHNEKKHIKLDRKSKEEMMHDKAAWAEAAKTDPFSLTLDEFLAFQHPESSAVNLLSLVDDLLRQFDIDGDDHLTLEEFSDVTADEGDEKYRKSIISRNVEERREQFKRIVDKNHDGKADRGELLSYVDPRHPRYALQESATLFNLTDTNKDRELSLEEVLLQSKIFMTSKMIDTSNSFHDEF